MLLTHTGHIQEPIYHCKEIGALKFGLRKKLIHMKRESEREREIVPLVVVRLVLTYLRGEIVGSTNTRTS